MQLVARARLCALYVRSGKRRQDLCMFDQESLLTYFDSLHTRTDLILNVTELPLRDELIKRRYRKRQLINLMEDEDGDVGDEGADWDSNDSVEGGHLHTQTASYNSGEPTGETYVTDDLDYNPGLRMQH